MNNSKPLTRAELDQAVYVDLEGTQDGDVSLVGFGYHSHGEWIREQWVTDARLDYYVAHSQKLGDPVRKGSWAATLGRLGELLAERSGTLVAFSAHEQEVLPVEARAAGVSLTFDYCNARPIGKSWARRMFPGLKPPPARKFTPGSGWSIEWFAQLMGVDVPNAYGAGHTGNRLRELRHAEMTTQRRTRVRKGKWTKLIGHNRFDIEIMRDLVAVAVV